MENMQNERMKDVITMFKTNNVGNTTLKELICHNNRISFCENEIESIKNLISNELIEKESFHTFTEKKRKHISESFLVEKKEYDDGNRKEKNLETRELLIRCCEILDELKENDDLRLQIQYITILIKKIDKIRTFKFVKNDRLRMKALAFVRLVLKLNGNDELLDDEKLELLIKIFGELESEQVENTFVKKYSEACMNIGLSVLPSWE